MLKKLTNKEKSITLGIIIAMVSLTSYQLAFDKTFALKNNCEITEEKLNKLEDAPERIDAIQRDIQKIDRYLGNENQYKDAEKALLEQVGRMCKQNEVIFKEFPGHHLISNKNYTLITYKMVLQGKFVPLLKVLHDLEKKLRFGKVASVDFRIKKDPRSGNKQLNMIFFVQGIKLPEK